MYTALDRYVLERSSIATTFRLGFLLIMGMVIFQLLPLILFFVVMCLAFILLFFFQPKSIQIFEHLEENSWSIKFQPKIDQNSVVQRVELLKMLDHYFYMVIYVQGKTQHSFIIWKDQMNDLQWKRLRMRCNLQ